MACTSIQQVLFWLQVWLPVHRCIMRYYDISLLFVLLVVYSCVAEESKEDTRCPNRTLAVIAMALGRAHNHQSRGILYDFFDRTFKICFHRCSAPVHMNWTYVADWQELQSAISEERGDIYLPITLPMQMFIQSKSAKIIISGENIAESSGFSFIVNQDVFNRKTQGVFLKSIVKMWPVLALILLMGGTSGVVMWTLVRSLQWFLWKKISLTLVMLCFQTSK